MQSQFAIETEISDKEAAKVHSSQAATIVRRLLGMVDLLLYTRRITSSV